MCTWVFLFLMQGENSSLVPDSPEDQKRLEEAFEGVPSWTNPSSHAIGRPGQGQTYYLHPKGCGRWSDVAG